MDIHCVNCKEPWDVDTVRHEEIIEVLGTVGTLGLPLWATAVGALIKSGQMDVPILGKTGHQLLREHWHGGTYEDLEEPGIRAAFKQCGWEFGDNVLVVLKCPSCPKDGMGVLEMRNKSQLRRDVTQALAEVLGDDLDGLASELSDFDIFYREHDE